MTTTKWGGSAAGGGFDFQAAVSAVCMVHMARGVPLQWCEAANDVPISVSAESGGAGDDIALQLIDARRLEVQAKRRLRAGAELWEALIALLRCAHGDASFRGVLAVGPSTSAAIREQLARDVVRLGQGRNDDLSPLAIALTERLDYAGIPRSACAQVRIQTVHVLEHDSASTQAALAHLANVTTQPTEAWNRLVAESLRLIRLRGRHDTASLAGLIPGLRSDGADPLGPAVVANRLLEWTLSSTASFTIPAVDRVFSLDDDWIELKAHGHDETNLKLDSLEEALTRYHDGKPASVASLSERDKFDAETLGYFVRHCVIVAGPGTGKTQLLRRIARLLARKREPALIVRLRPLAERMRSGETFLEAALQVGLDASLLRSEEVRVLGMQNLTLLLDGLDEAGSEQENIARAALALVAACPRCRVVFTTRPVGYETALLKEWRQYELIPIEKSDARRSVQRLVDAFKGGDDTKIKEATAAATQQLEYTRHNRFEAKSPLLIALLASLALNGVVAAKTREGLYGQLFKLIEKVAVAKSHGTQLTPAVLKAVLQQLGWELAVSPYADIEQILSACAKLLAVELGETLLKARAICDQALAFWEAAGIIERIRFRSSEALTFVHKTFGEYAAAQHLRSRDMGARASLLAMIEPETQWTEVLVFASALGMGADLVSIALMQNREGSRQVEHLLRWTKHSGETLPVQMAEAVLDRAWEVIEGPHSGNALQIGADLVAASEKLSGAMDRSQRNCIHSQWWTAIVAWACFVRRSPDLVDFRALLAFMDSYDETADTRKIGGGFDLHSPVRVLWEDLLLSTSREAVRRGIGLEEQKFIDRVKASLGAHRMGFLGDFSHILSEAGIELAVPNQGNLASKFFDPDLFAQSRKGMLVLVGAVGSDSMASSEIAEPPFLHLSAFWYGTGLMSLDFSAVSLAGDDMAGRAGRDIIAWAAHQSAYDYRQLLVEAQTKAQALVESDMFGTYDGLLAVDAPVRWNSKTANNAVSLLERTLVHPSEWIVHLSANLAAHHLTVAEIEWLVPQVLARAEGAGIAAAGYLAVEFLGKDKARELFVARLEQPLSSGCKYLFPYLARVWDPSLDAQISRLVRPALFFGPRNARAALEVVRLCREPYRKALAPLLNEAYDYWLEHEGPYPKEGGRIPESPRGELIQLRIEEGAISLDDLFVAAKDRRSEVSKAANDALMAMLSSSEAGRSELVRRIHAGEELNGLLRTCLRNNIPFGYADAESISRLLESSRPQDRHAALGILQTKYLPPDKIRQCAERLLADPYQQIRDEAHESIVSIEKAFNGGAL